MSSPSTSPTGGSQRPLSPFSPSQKPLPDTPRDEQGNFIGSLRSPTGSPRATESPKSELFATENIFLLSPQSSPDTSQPVQLREHVQQPQPENGTQEEIRSDLSQEQNVQLRLQAPIVTKKGPVEGPDLSAGSSSPAPLGNESASAPVLGAAHQETTAALHTLPRTPVSIPDSSVVPSSPRSISHKPGELSVSSSHKPGELSVSSQAYDPFEGVRDARASASKEISSAMLFSKRVSAGITSVRQVVCKAPATVITVTRMVLGFLAFGLTCLLAPVRQVSGWGLGVIAEFSINGLIRQPLTAVVIVVAEVVAHCWNVGVAGVCTTLAAVGIVVYRVAEHVAYPFVWLLSMGSMSFKKYTTFTQKPLILFARVFAERRDDEPLSKFLGNALKAIFQHSYFGGTDKLGKTAKYLADKTGFAYHYFSGDKPEVTFGLFHFINCSTVFGRKDWKQHLMNDPQDVSTAIIGVPISGWLENPGTALEAVFERSDDVSNRITTVSSGFLSGLAFCWVPILATPACVIANVKRKGLWRGLSALTLPLKAIFVYPFVSAIRNNEDYTAQKEEEESMGEDQNARLQNRSDLSSKPPLFPVLVEYLYEYGVLNRPGLDRPAPAALAQGALPGENNNVVSSQAAEAVVSPRPTSPVVVSSQAAEVVVSPRSTSPVVVSSQAQQALASVSPHANPEFASTAPLVSPRATSLNTPQMQFFLRNQQQQRQRQPFAQIHQQQALLEAKLSNSTLSLEQRYPPFKSEASVPSDVPLQPSVDTISLNHHLAAIAAEGRAVSEAIASNQPEAITTFLKSEDLERSASADDAAAESKVPFEDSARSASADGAAAPAGRRSNAKTRRSKRAKNKAAANKAANRSTPTAQRTPTKASPKNNK